MLDDIILIRKIGLFFITLSAGYFSYQLIIISVNIILNLFSFTKTNGLAKLLLLQYLLWIAFNCAIIIGALSRVNETISIMYISSLYMVGASLFCQSLILYQLRKNYFAPTKKLVKNGIIELLKKSLDKINSLKSRLL